MATTYRKPGVYLEEANLRGPGEIGTAQAIALFVGVASRGSSIAPQLVTSWPEYDAAFGGFTQMADPALDVSYLPYAVYNYFQNGGRNAYIMRAIGSSGVAAFANVKDAVDATAFTVNAKSEGVWGNDLAVGIAIQEAGGTSTVYTLTVYKIAEGAAHEVERFQNLSVSGTVPGTKRVDYAINDEVYGSKYISVSDLDATKIPVEVDNSSINSLLNLEDGSDGDLPSSTSGDLGDAAEAALASVEGPVILNIVGYRPTDTSSTTYVSETFDPNRVTRGDVFVINDNFPPRDPASSSDAYADTILDNTSSIGSLSGNSYVAAYVPWIVAPDPAVNGGTITVPPGGAIAGVFARTDATNGVFQSPAGLNANMTNVLNVDARFNDVKLGSLNAKNINVVRPIPGTGLCIMGGRTRKSYGVDRYINARRTLIYIEQSLKASTQFALFQNNDEALWSQLTATADRILRPVWNSGGLRGASAREAFFVTCDASINTPDVIASGEVRMEVGVALEYPAEFIVIRVSQFDSGNTTTTVVA